MIISATSQHLVRFSETFGRKRYGGLNTGPRINGLSCQGTSVPGEGKDDAPERYIRERRRNRANERERESSACRWCTRKGKGMAARGRASRMNYEQGVRAISGSARSLSPACCIYFARNIPILWGRQSRGMRKLPFLSVREAFSAFSSLLLLAFLQTHTKTAAKPHKISFSSGKVSTRRECERITNGS